MNRPPIHLSQHDDAEEPGAEHMLPASPPASVSRRTVFELGLGGLSLAFGLNLGTGAAWAGLGVGTSSGRPIRVVSGPLRNQNLDAVLSTSVDQQRMNGADLSFMIVGSLAGAVGAVLGVTDALVAVALACIGGSYAAGPIGAAIAGLVALGVGLATAFMALAERVNNENTTTIVVINRLRGSTVRAMAPTLKEGEVIASYANELGTFGVSTVATSGVLGAASSTDDEDQALAITVQSHNHGIKGRLLLNIEATNGTAQVGIRFHNREGVESRGSGARARLKMGAPGLCSVSCELTTLQGEARRDLVVVVVGDPGASDGELSTWGNTALADATIPVV